MEVGEEMESFSRKSSIQQPNNSLAYRMGQW